MILPNWIIKEDLIKRFIPSIFREILRFCYLKECLIETDEGSKSFGYLKQVMLKNLLNAYRYPERTVWTTLFVPPEILYAMDLNIFCLEVGASLFSKIGKSQTALKEAEAHGIPTDVCSFHRAALGYVFKNFYPKAIYHASTSTLCDSNSKTIKICQSITEKDITLLDVPYDLNDDSVRFLAEQLEDFVRQLERYSGRIMDKDSLKQAIECSNRTRKTMIEVNKLREDPNSSLTGSKALGLIVPSHLLCGSKEGEEFYSLLLNDIKEQIRLARINGGPRDNKKIKILWLELKPYFNDDLLHKIEDRAGVNIVFEEINHVYWDEMDPERPYESLARKLISNHYNGPLENRLKVVRMLAKQYNVNGVIMFTAWGCRRNGAAVPAIKEELKRQGVPLLVLDGDCIDESNYTEGQFLTRVEGFFEMLSAR